MGDGQISDLDALLFKVLKGYPSGNSGGIY